MRPRAPPPISVSSDTGRCPPGGVPLSLSLSWVRRWLLAYNWPSNNTFFLLFPRLDYWRKLTTYVGSGGFFSGKLLLGESDEMTTALRLCHPMHRCLESVSDNDQRRSAPRLGEIPKLDPVGSLVFGTQIGSPESSSSWSDEVTIAPRRCFKCIDVRADLEVNVSDISEEVCMKAGDQKHFKLAVCPFKLVTCWV